MRDVIQDGTRRADDAGADQSIRPAYTVAPEVYRSLSPGSTIGYVPASSRSVVVRPEATSTTASDDSPNVSPGYCAVKTTDRPSGPAAGQRCERYARLPSPGSSEVIALDEPPAALTTWSGEVDVGAKTI